LIVLAVCLTGCANSVAGLLGESLGLPLVDKTVASKVAPNTLVATDGTTCGVSEKRWEKTKEGDDVACVWTMK
jgi:hypothetical protein